LSKDVDLLSRTIKDLTAGSVLLAPAQAFIHELEARNAEAS
jgi:hypothetical protein